MEKGIKEQRREREGLGKAMGKRDRQTQKKMDREWRKYNRQIGII